jgi:hypothetical protein
VHAGFWLRNVWEKIYLEDLGVDGRIILKLIFKKGDRGKEGMDRAQDMDV